MSILRASVQQTGSPNEAARVAQSPSLRAIRAAIRSGESELSRASAIDMLATSGYPAMHRDLQALLEDETAPPKVRYLAALNLPRGDRRAAHEILISATRYRDDRVRSGVMRALGQIGGKDALEAIARVLPDMSGSARAQAVFAATLIAHRLGLSGYDAPLPNEAEVLALAPEQGVRVHVRRALSIEAERSLVALGNRPYGIELAEAPVYEYRCDRCSGTIMLNREFTVSEALDVLRLRKALFAIGTLRDDASGGYSAAALFLTAPDPNTSAIRISVHLTNGTQLFVGHADLRGGEAYWHLRAVRRLGAFPIRAEGGFRDGQLTIKLAASGTRIVDRARPRALADRSSVRNVVQQSRA